MKVPSLLVSSLVSAISMIACSIVGLLPSSAHAQAPPPQAASPVTAVSVQTVEQVVRKSAAFAGDRKATVAVAGNEVNLSTYALSANSPATDLKIEALTVSKEIMEALPAVTRTRVRFYEPASTEKYREVVVTIGDVKAFAAGAINKDQLLSALAVTQFAKPAAASTAAKTKSKDASAQAAVQAKSQLQTFTGEGLTFNYPSDWFVAAEPQNKYFLRLQHTNGSYVSIRHSKSKTDLRKWVGEEDQEHSARADYAPIAVPQQLRFGVGGSIAGYNRAYSYGKKGKQVYQQYVYFGWPNRIYKVKLVAPEKVYVASAQALKDMLNTFQIQR